MFPLIVNVDVVKVGLPSECEALSNVAHGHQLVLVLLNALHILDVCIDELLVELDVLKLGGHVHHVKYAV